MNIEKKLFGKTSSNQDIYEYILSNKNISVHIIQYGAIIKNLIYKDKDIVLGYDELSDYEDNPNYFGATIGRCANRIEKGLFTINKTHYKLEQNNGENHLHGGSNGLHKQIWEVIAEQTHTSYAKLVLKLVQKEEYDGYPGNLTIFAIFFLTQDSLIVNYTYKSDIDSIANLTAHPYFNLSGEKNILSHKIILNSKLYTNSDGYIPSGEILSVEKTPFDFTNIVQIGENLDKYAKQLSFTRGYDHNFVLEKKSEYIEFEALKIPVSNKTDIEEVSDINFILNGIISNESNSLNILIYSDAPCFQLYTGNFIDNIKGKYNNIYNKYAGVCIEPQFAPNAINTPNFESTKIFANHDYSRNICYKITENLTKL
ncbi:MAG: aldose epimerase family protein [Peptoanaerobacter stomatis]|uniref:aldose epimerase family protein n=1 Tax=Peptoanaerobacter stomatis TaxID=796937 RepID=UPI003F9FFF0B